MSRSKDALGAVPWLPGRGAPRARLRRVDQRHPCPVCGRVKLCSVTADGAKVLCTREAAGAVHVGRDGVAQTFVHVLGPDAARKVSSLAPMVSSTATRAPAGQLDRAHRALLAGLDLDPSDRDGLIARGLDLGAVDAGGYRTLPARGRAALARAVVAAVGETFAAGVPGMVRREDGPRAWWSVAGCPGIIVPVRDLEGRVVSLRVRRRDSGDGPRYLYLSSAREGGAPALVAVHVPVAARRGASRLIVTEGELKADVATHLGGDPVVSVPGVGAWRLALDTARAWCGAAARGSLTVVTAFDADMNTNPAVARAARELHRALTLDGFDARVKRWSPAEGKGLDDYLCRRAARPMESTR